jgi:hypothetical protein
MQQTELDRLRSILQLCVSNGLQILCHKTLASYKLIKKLFHIKYNVLNYITHYLSLSLCSVISSLNKLNCDRKSNSQSHYRNLCTKHPPTHCIKTLCLCTCTGNKSNQTVMKLTFSLSWELSIAPQVDF